VTDSSDNSKAEPARKLADAIRRVRTAEAERSDVVVELRDAERARLDMLADELKGVFAEVPSDNEQFLFTVAAGTPPRLWIDMTAFVTMGRDRRTYRFLKDTRLGRTVILETANIDDMADCVTHYVAERIIERERAIEGDWLLKRIMRDEKDAKKGEGRRSVLPSVPAGDGRNLGWIIAALLLGVLIGAAALLGTAWFSIG
jgi:hypothetical protein